jgi:integral membrane protein (TIGR01906 family)
MTQPSTSPSTPPPAFTLNILLAWLVILLMPVALSLTAVRIVLNHWYPEFEYRTPGFPADPYGFTFEDRLKYAHIAIEYLRNDADISFLGDLRFPDGQQAPWESCQYMDDCNRFYNDRELQHMLDVKNVVLAARNVWLVALVALIILAGVSWRGGWFDAFKHALSLGGRLTLAVIAAVLVGVFFLFDWLFVVFHRIFFTGDTWLFLNSDSLIRLFPERFWSDTFIMVGVLTVVMALFFVLIEKILKRLHV